MVAAVAGARGLYLACALLAAFAATAAAQPAPRELPVPRMTLYPGHLVGEHSLVQRAFHALDGGGRGLHVSAATLLGRTVRRTLVAGQPIPLDAVKDADLVLQGREYPLVFRAAGLIITGVGVPLQSGAAGELIAVRNPETGRVVKGRVMPDATLAVEAP